MAEEKRIVKKEETLPATFNEVSDMAKAFVQSGYFSDTKQLAHAIVKIQAGKELGLPPVYSMQNINLIRDRLTCSANTMAMMVKKSGRYNYRITEHTDTACSITFYEIEESKMVAVGVSTFTMEDAKRADLIKPGGGWVKYPRAMLFSRAISQGARIYAPDAIGGIYTDEEIRSIPQRPNEKDEVVEGEVVEEKESETVPEPTESKGTSSAKAPPLKTLGDLYARGAKFGLNPDNIFDAVKEDNPDIIQEEDIVDFDKAWKAAATKFAVAIKAYQEATG